MSAMQYELISDEDYHTLPLENDLCFVAFESICRRNMNKIIAGMGHEFDSNIYAQYIAIVSGIAEECGINGVDVGIVDIGNVFDQYAAFLRNVQREVARIRLRNRRGAQLTVVLTSNNRAKIFRQINRLRELIEASEISDERKRRMFQKLDDLIVEVGEHRISLGKTMLILSLLLTAIGSTVGIAADSRDAVNNIMSLIGEDKQTEDEAIERLAPPPKALPRPAPRPHAIDDLDDDIPF